MTAPYHYTNWSTEGFGGQNKLVYPVNWLSIVVQITRSRGAVGKPLNCETDEQMKEPSSKPACRAKFFSPVLKSKLADN